jgi:hypothetical protein
MRKLMILFQGEPFVRVVANPPEECRVYGAGMLADRDIFAIDKT